MWKFVWMSLSFFTVRKRSLRRLYFYTCLLVILFTGGVSRPMPRGCLPGGCPGPSPGGVQEQARWGSQTHAGGVSKARPRGVCIQHALRQAPLLQQAATAADSTHPTGMYSCSYIFLGPSSICRSTSRLC